jgi:hypothetical protein
LRDVDAGAGDVRAIVYIHDPADRSAMNAHAHLQFRMAAQRLADFQRALHRCVWRRRKNESHAVAGWNADKFAGGFRAPERLGVSDNLIKVLEQLMLLVDQPFRITDDVYEQDMGNLESKIGFRFGHKTQ